MNKNIIIILIIALAISWAYFINFKHSSQYQTKDLNNFSQINQLYTARKSNIFVSGKGIVKKILADDNEGSRHQRFILELGNGQSLLIVHNIDLAQRLPNLQINDEVSFAGDYIYNEKGGTIHWTHKDPRKKHRDGFLMYKGKIYQ